MYPTLRSLKCVFLILPMGGAAEAEENKRQDPDDHTVVVERSVLIESTARVDLDRADIARLSALSVAESLAQVRKLQ